MRVAIRYLAIVTLVWVTGASSRAQTMQPVKDLDSLKGLPECVPSAPSGYPGHRCVIKIDRQSPISPPTLLVPPGTDVLVEVYHTRSNEVLLFNLVTTHTAPPDVAGAAVRNIISPLQTLVFTTRNIQAFDGGQPSPDKTDVEQTRIRNRLNSTLGDIRHATAALTCLSNYQELLGDYSCSQAAPLAPTTFGTQKDNAVALATSAATEILPSLEIKNLDESVKNPGTCLADAAQASPTEQDQKKQDCVEATNRHMTNEGRLNSAIADIQKAQSALLVSVQTLEEWLYTHKEQPVACQVTSSKLNNMVVVITGQEVVNKTSSPVATVTINTQNTNWAISTGILFSNLKFHTFTNAPVIVNGKPVLDTTGKTSTIVARSDTSPAVIAPELLISYRIPQLSRFAWENKCRGGCSFLLSGGVGANLTSKSADFDAGFSLQIGSVLFTPTVHFGRENRLSNGVTVGAQLGPSPPSPLPTNYQWVKKFGIAITYVLPIP